MAGPPVAMAAIRYRTDALTLSITDDGRGFDPGRAAESGRFGLVGIRERAARLGSLQIDSQPERGTRLQVTVNAPYEET